jgi:hypothetical protein
MVQYPSRTSQALVGHCLFFMYKKTAKWIMNATSAMGLDIWLIKIFLCKLQPAMENFVV